MYIKKTSKDALKLLWNRGNVWGVAIGLIIGSALSAVVTSFTRDIILELFAKWINIETIENWVIWGKTDFDGNLINGIKIGKFLSTLIVLMFIFFFMWGTIIIWLFFWNKVRLKDLVYKGLHLSPEDKIEDIQVTIHDIQKIEESLNNSIQKINIQLEELKQIKEKIDISKLDDGK